MRNSGCCSIRTMTASNYKDRGSDDGKISRQFGLVLRETRVRVVGGHMQDQQAKPRCVMKGVVVEGVVGGEGLGIKSVNRRPCYFLGRRLEMENASRSETGI